VALVTIAPPALEPVALEMLKGYLRLDQGDTSQDGVLQALAESAREWVEDYTRRRLITQTVRLTLDHFPGYMTNNIWAPLFLPLPPVQAVASFTYIGQNGIPQAMVADVNYNADLLSSPARLMPPWGSLWPCPRLVPSAVTIDLIVGYGDTPDKVPMAIRTAIMQLAATRFENRLPDSGDVPKWIKAVLMGYRNLRLQ